MTNVTVSLNTVESVKAFVDGLTKFDCDFDLGTSRVLIDAKSILGILSLGLKKPLALTIHQQENLDPIIETIRPYLVVE